MTESEQETVEQVTCWREGSMFRKRIKVVVVLLTMVVVLLTVTNGPLVAQESPPTPTPELWGIPTIPGVTEARTPQQMSNTIRVLLLLTVLSVAPSILIMTTCFTRIVIVLSLLRHALATQQLPPNQIIVGLALFLTFMIMTPTWQEVHEQSLSPLMAGQITAKQAYERGVQPMRRFMFQQVRRPDLAMFMRVAKIDPNTQLRDVPTTVLIPSFIISELKTAFIMGFILYLPFLVIDMVTASVLISMGMLMLPPILISLPFKLLLFVLADGWNLVVKSLVESFL